MGILSGLEQLISPRGGLQFMSREFIIHQELPELTLFRYILVVRWGLYIVQGRVGMTIFKGG
jgi:hypothetical protein